MHYQLLLVIFDRSSAIWDRWRQQESSPKNPRHSKPQPNKVPAIKPIEAKRKKPAVATMTEEEQLQAAIEASFRE